MSDHITEEDVRKAHQQYLDQLRQVDLIYGNLGKAFTSEKMHKFFRDLFDAYWKNKPKYVPGQETPRHPWFPTEATPNYFAWMQHEYNRISFWIKREQARADKLRLREIELKERLKAQNSCTP